jgi:hypothetical protein
MHLPAAKRAWPKGGVPLSSSSKHSSFLGGGAWRQQRSRTSIIVALVVATAVIQVYSGNWFGTRVGSFGGARLFNARSQPPSIGGSKTNTQSTKSSSSSSSSSDCYAGLSTFDAHASSPFKPSTVSSQWPPKQFYKGLPVGSEFRPSGQFYVPNPQLKPVITIVTATRNPREIFFTRTVRFVLQQSLQAFRWIVVNDGSDDAVSLLRLKELGRWAAAHEADRILVVDRPCASTARDGGCRAGNGPAAMNYGLRFVGNTEFVAILDDDDLWELTTLEKAALVMTWVSSAYAVSFDVVNHGAKQFLWRRGFYNGDESFFTENNLMQGSPFRASVLRKCRFREDMAEGGADWDFWMCMASHGMWGLHVPEIGNWYQWNPPDFRKRRWKAVTTRAGLVDLRQGIQRRYANLAADNKDAWPAMVLPPPLPPAAASQEDDKVAGGLARRQAPLANRVVAAHQRQHRQRRRAVLLLLRDLRTRTTAASAYDAGAVIEYARIFAKAGWRVTVLMTHYADDNDDDNDRDDSTTKNTSGSFRRRLALMQSTHDVFVAANIAPLLRMPDLVAYLVRSRGIEAIAVMADPSPLNISRRLVEASMALLEYAVAVLHAEELASLEDSKVDIVRATERAIAARGARAGDGGFNQARRDPPLQAPSWPAFARLRLASHHSVDRGIDMRQVQLALQYRKKRVGFGRELQIACPERVYANTRWIDALEHQKACAGGTTDAATLDAVSLQRSALKQCGAWCLINLDETAAKGDVAEVGWEFTGSCFRPLASTDDSPKCKAELVRRHRVFKPST